MEHDEDPSFIHEEGEDDYISLRRPLSQHVSMLADAFSDTDTLWNSKQRRQFNAKLRRVGSKNPEWMDTVEGKSLAQVSERLTHLARIRPCTCMQHIQMHLTFPNLFLCITSLTR